VHTAAGRAHRSRSCTPQPVVHTAGCPCTACAPCTGLLRWARAPCPAGTIDGALGPAVIGLGWERGRRPRAGESGRR